jgi:hypothetical protein
MPKSIRWLLIAILAVGLVAGGAVTWALLNRKPVDIAERCEATLGRHTVTVDIEQAQNAALIAGMSIKRELIPRAASIALATAYQESKIRNLDYGHADSIGIFQQRPSKGWGTIEEIMDPWYSTGKFYSTMVRVKNWKTKDINDVAQAVQRSAFPEAYRQHESNARALASALTGETEATFTCSIQSAQQADPKAMRSFLNKTYGKDAAKVTLTEKLLRIEAKDTPTAWAVAQGAVANAKRYGIAKVQTEGRSWMPESWTRAEWQPDATAASRQVVLTFND